MDRMSPIAADIMKARLKAAKKLSLNVAKLLERLGFKNARLKYMLHPCRSRGLNAEADANLSFPQIRGNRFWGWQNSLQRGIGKGNARVENDSCGRRFYSAFGL